MSNCWEYIRQTAKDKLKEVLDECDNWVDFVNWTSRTHPEIIKEWKDESNPGKHKG